MLRFMVPWRERAEEAERANPLRLLRDEMERMFNPFTEGWLVPVGATWTPPLALHVAETENEVTYRAELPGFEVPEVDVRVSDDFLTIRAEHREAAEGAAKNRPAARRSVERTVSLPPGTNPENVTATYRNGLLEIHFPRVPVPEPRRIEVTT